MPLTVLDLNSGHLALENIGYFLADYVVACEDLSIGHPVFLYLGADTPTLLKDRVATPNNTDCSPGDLLQKKGRYVRHLLLAIRRKPGNGRRDKDDKSPIYLPVRRSTTFARPPKKTHCTTRLYRTRLTRRSTAKSKQPCRTYRMPHSRTNMQKTSAHNWLNC